MVSGIIVQILITLVLMVIAYFAGASLYLKGWIAGMKKEAMGWVDALNKVQPPNWQSLPHPPGYDRERAEAAAKVYVEAFRVALDVIKEEIAVNRMNALIKEFGEGMSLEEE